MNMNNTISRVPPGFRFHPTDEELVDYYLRKKVAGRKVDLDVIKDVDLYKLEPWDLQEICRIGAEEQNEWYLFSHKDKKYPTGTRTNRATSAGFWKATGRDKPIYSKLRLVGMRKTLVYYKGRAPNGQKSDWIMHEYRLETNENGPPQEEGWVVCRVFKKRLPSTRRSSDDLPWYNYEEQANSLLMQDYIDGSPSRPTEYHHRQLFSYKKSDLLNLHYHSPATDEPDLYELPPIESTKSLNCYVNHGSSSIRFISTISDKEANMQQRNQLVEAISIDDNSNENTSQLASDQVTDWRVLDKFVASQLSHGGSQQPIYSEEADHDQILQGADEQEVACMEFPSIASTTSCQIYPWK